MARVPGQHPGRRKNNTTADTIIFDGLPAGYLAKSALDHALAAT
jgi:hypothetical protein